MKSHDIANAARKRAIAMLKEGTRPAQVLHHIATAAESITPPGSAASILIVDERGLLRNGASPQIPDEDLKVIEGLKPQVELRHLARALGYVGGWSTPIKGKDGVVIGTLGIYQRELREPTKEERDAMQTLALAAAQALTTTVTRQPIRAR
jgi:GAF domain-containing protein